MHIERITHLVKAMHEPRFAVAFDKIAQQKLGEGAVDAVTGIAKIAFEAGQAPNHGGCRALGGKLRCAVWLGAGEGLEAKSESVRRCSPLLPCLLVQRGCFGRATFFCRVTAERSFSFRLQVHAVPKQGGAH